MKHGEGSILNRSGIPRQKLSGTLAVRLPRAALLAGFALPPVSAPENEPPRPSRAGIDHEELPTEGSRPDSNEYPAEGRPFAVGEETASDLPRIDRNPGETFFHTVRSSFANRAEAAVESAITDRETGHRTEKNENVVSSASIRESSMQRNESPVSFPAPRREMPDRVESSTIGEDSTTEPGFSSRAAEADAGSDGEQEAAKKTNELSEPAPVFRRNFGQRPALSRAEGVKTTEKSVIETLSAQEKPTSSLRDLDKRAREVDDAKSRVIHDAAVRPTDSGSVVFTEQAFGSRNAGRTSRPKDRNRDPEIAHGATVRTTVMGEAGAGNNAVRRPWNDGFAETIMAAQKRGTGSRPTRHVHIKNLQGDRDPAGAARPDSG